LLKHSNTAPCFNSLPFQGRAGEGVLGDMGYTKHYGVYAERSRSAGSERVCSKLGGGLLLAPVMPTEATVEAIFEDYEQMRNRLFDLINKFANYNPHPEQQTVTYIDIEPYLGGIQDYLDRHEPEENRFFYHPDHLGSSNFITDAAGDGYQHLQYLPFGETAVSQKLSWWSTPYQFTGKEKDDETGYSYFGARYYNSDLSVWLSVDPLSDKYPSMSPYMYCAGNPIGNIDPDGKYFFGLFGSTKSQRQKAKMVAASNNGKINDFHKRSINVEYLTRETGLYSENYYGDGYRQHIVRFDKFGNTVESGCIVSSNTPAGQGDFGFGRTVKNIALAANVAGIAISASAQTIQNTRLGGNFAYAISGNTKAVNAASNIFKYTPYVGLAVTAGTGSYLSIQIDPATGRPYQSWGETATDIGVNIATMYIGAKFGGWYGAGAAAFYLGVKYNVQYQIRMGIDPASLFILYKE
jgi:RHS repeat-associated protein